ncbi:MAG: tyrosine-type recombinase/integrase [Candidatus Cybelea sp.]
MRSATRPSIKRSDANAFTSDEVTRLLEMTPDTRWESFVMLALSTGARRGELCGLSCDDYDAAAGTLMIRHSLSQTRRGLALKATKNGQHAAATL